MIYIYLLLTFLVVAIVFFSIISLVASLYLINSISATFKKDYVPSLSTPREIFPQLLREIELDDSSVLFDLGCGSGELLAAIYRAYPEAACRGLERELFPYLAARLNNWRAHSSNFKIIRTDFLNYDLSTATHLVTYLYGQIMDKLLSKLERELRRGTVLISVDYCFSDKKPNKIIDLDRSTCGRGKKLYVYKF